MQGSRGQLGLLATVRKAPHPSQIFPAYGGHPSLPGFEPPASGPGPVTNRSRRNGVSNYDQLVGDYTNPILKPGAAEVVKKKGAGARWPAAHSPNPAKTQCWPEPVAVTFAGEFCDGDVSAAGPDYDSL